VTVNAGITRCACAYSKPWSQCLFNLDHATLEDDPDFKIENHVKFHQSQLMETALAIFRKPLGSQAAAVGGAPFQRVCGELLISCRS